MLMQSQFTALIRGELSDEEAREFLSRMEPGDVTAEQFGELIEEMLASANPEFKALEEYAAQSLDCCGTGGSGLPRFNTSTAVSFVLAAAGVKVAKFGNRAASSKSGSFDVLQQLGIPADVSASAARALLDEHNIVFLFAPAVYPSLARLAAVRKSLSKKTVFNFTGPLLNPVRPHRRLLGVSDAHMSKSVAAVLERKLETKLAWIVRAGCGLDELCPDCQASVQVVGTQSDEHLHSRIGSAVNAAGVCRDSNRPAPMPEDNAKLMLQIFDGAVDSSAYSLVCINAAAGLLVAGKCSDQAQATAMVKELLASGKVKDTFNKVVGAYERHA